MRLWHLWCGCQQQQQLVELSQPGFKALAREWLWHKESRLSPLVLAERHHCLLRHQETGFHPLLVGLAAEGTCCSCAHVWQRQRGERGQAGVSGLCSVLCSSGRPRLPCSTLWESIQTSRAWGPLDAWLYCFNNNLSRRFVSLMNTDERSEIWFN